jgi:hypothetical protein
MADSTATRADFARYAAILERSIAGHAPFMPTAEDASTIQVERGTMLARALLNDEIGGVEIDRLIDLSMGDRISRIVIADASGHHRPVYRPLLIYSCLQTFRKVYELLPRSEFGRWEEGLRPWCDLLEAELGEMEWPSNSILPAGRGASASEAAWNALALSIAGKVFIRDAWTDLAADTFGRLTRAQRPTGAWLAAAPADNPETHWYHELVLLHAAASYAVQTEDRPLASAVGRNASYHLGETQPDHATSQPWGVFAFIWDERTRTLADQVLHAAKATASGGVSLMLLADALYCLRLFL